MEGDTTSETMRTIPDIPRINTTDGDQYKLSVNLLEDSIRSTSMHV